MGVMTRLVRLIKADVHGVMDQMEDRGLLLNQYLRDMEEALAQKEEDLRHQKAVRERTRTEREDCAEAVAKLESDLDSAVEKGRDDIARFLIKKRGPLVRHRDALDKYLRKLDGEIGEAEACLVRQQQQYAEVRLKSREHARRTEEKEWETRFSTLMAEKGYETPGEEEIELELMRRKEKLAERRTP